MSEQYLINNLRLYRVSRDLSQAELAEHAGVSRKTISAIENASTHPSVMLALILAQVLDASVEDLFSLTNASDSF